MGRCEPKPWALPGGLAGLFAGLLAGCVAPGEPIDDTFGEMCAGGCSCTHDSAELRLSRAEYGMWVGEDAVTSSGSGEPTGSSGEMGTSGSSGDTEAMGTSGSSGEMGTSGSSGDMGTSGSSGGGDAFDPAALTESICVALCKQEAGAIDWLIECSVPELTPEGEVHIVCTWTTGCDGRRHAWLRSSGAGAGGDAVTSWLARAAHDEAGSVHAFVALRRELAEHGAPRALLGRLRRAAADERRHARVVARLVRWRGGRWRRPVVVAGPRRDLLAIAIENAVEGCVRETWAALSAAHQARVAGDGEIRAAMVGIAADEQGHAELAWALDEWLRGQLDDDAWVRVEAARAGAARELRAGLRARRLASEVVRGAGVVDGEAALGLVDGLAAALWSGRPD